MRHVVYLALLGGCVVATLPLELVLHTRVYARWRRLVLSLVPAVVLFGGWDLIAIAHHTWRYDSRYLVGLTLPGHMPVEEFFFFLVVPTCSVLTFEAVRARRPDWLVDEGSETSRRT